VPLRLLLAPVLVVRGSMLLLTVAWRGLLRISALAVSRLLVVALVLAVSGLLTMRLAASIVVLVRHFESLCVLTRGWL
jgi:hypothetical protein